MRSTAETVFFKAFLSARCNNRILEWYLLFDWKIAASSQPLPRYQSELNTGRENLGEVNLRTQKSVARIQQNPRILNISFVTFRHRGATMLNHQTRNILIVKKLLSHKKITNTMKYAQVIQFKDDEHEVQSATTVEKAKTVLAAALTV